MAASTVDATAYCLVAQKGLKKAAQMVDCLDATRVVPMVGTTGALMAGP